MSFSLRLLYRSCRHGQEKNNFEPAAKPDYMIIAHIGIQPVVNGKTHTVGYFTDEVEAAKAYDEAAEIHHGDFAALNLES
jgi:hypothetical protein